MSNTQELILFGQTLCDIAAHISQHYFRTTLDIDLKQDESPVTIADREIEKQLRQAILARYPDHAIIGEEFGCSGESAWQWIIDPIDGTRSFISGFPTYATLIALLHEQRPILSIIDMPILRERFSATLDTQTVLNDKLIRTSKTTTLAHAKLQSTDPGMFTQAQWEKRSCLAQHVALNRFNGDGYLYGMLAAGWIDLVVEADLKPHDFLPLTLIVEQAGGVITDWAGQPLDLNSRGEVIAAANPTLHQAALAALNM